MTEKELTQLKRERGVVKGQVTRIQNFFAGFDEATGNFDEVEARLQKIQELWNLYDEIQLKIENIDEAGDQLGHRGDFETSYYRAVSTAKRILAPPPLQTIEEGLQGLERSQLRHRMALIDECTSLFDIQKFYYLRSSLLGVASQVINSLETTAANYTIAWDLLKSRFENKRLILHHHVQSLFEIATIPKESAPQLRKLVDDSLKHLRALNSLGQPTDNWDCLMVYLISSKLDPVARRKWESSISVNAPPTFKQLTDFLTQYCSVLETLQPSKHTTSKIQSERKEQKPEQAISCASTKNNSYRSCVVCKGEYSIYNCSTFKNASIEARVNEVKRHKLCFNCLRENHTVEKCLAGGCKHCGKRYNTLLHFDESRAKANDDHASAEKSSFSSDNRSNCSKDQSNSLALSYCVLKKKPQVLLSTALVKIYDKSGNPRVCRALLDSGSQSNLITRDLCERLQLTKQWTNISLSGVSLSSSSVTESIHASIKSRINEFKTKLSFLVLEHITGHLPTLNFDVQQIEVPRNVPLADASFHIPGKIDLLLGASIFWTLLCMGQLRIPNSQLILQKTKLGWIVSGTIPFTEAKPETAQTVVCGFTSDQELDQQVERFWKIEEHVPHKKYSNEEQICEDEFRTTYRRDQNGRFIVGLSFRYSIDELGESRDTALKRLQAVNRRLDRDPELKIQYKAFMDEYLALGHMTEVPEDSQTKHVRHYIPHHAVMKESSTTTKLRIVFDASCKTATTISLNDILRVGPTIQPDIFSIVARFRQHRHVITADVTKMYRQVNLQEDQRDLQRILWRTDSQHPVKEYRLNTVTYGLATAPFLAIRCLHQLAYDIQDENPTIANIIRNDFYVDDLLTGADTIDQARSIKQEVSRILLTGGFPLGKWNTNTPVIIEEECETNLAADRPIGEEVKTLGLYWNPEDDVFRYKVSISDTNKRATKRNLLSLISQIYDPLGLVGPACITAKIILQHLWRQKIGWDESLPADLHMMWIQYYTQLSAITNITIPRVIVCANPTRIELHGFCDASESAYGACVFIKSISTSGQHTVRLHSAKSRVAPLKVVTLPRLELCGALLLAQLARKVTKALTLTIDEKHYWSDSQIALAWIMGESFQWKTFVANRIAEIQRLTDKNCWHHVRSRENPADVISRGINPEKLKERQLWWKGPPWLSQPIKEYNQDLGLDEESANMVFTEQIEPACILNIVVKDFEILARYSSLPKLRRILAYCLRFIDNVKKRNLNDNQVKKRTTIRDVCTSSVEELNRSMTSILKLSQAQDFPRELHDLASKRNLQATSKLATLSPFIDDAGLIRVGGRLRHAPIPYARRFPIVLASRSHITTLIIRDEHMRNLHAGTQALLSSLGERYWILCARSTVRRVLHACITCFRLSARSPSQMMGNLPEVRVTPSKAFLNVGLDYGGPFSIKVSRNKTAKAYLCLFICLATRAVHLEVATDLSTTAFLNALKRFIARRGKCTNIYSDNGSNFTGANNELKDLAKLLQTNEQRISECLAEQFIQWHFISPYSPHMGGIWEAGIKSAKTHLKRILSNALLTFEEFYTVLTEIEACLNSRPISAISNDPNDLTALTPGHFLIGSPLTAIPHVDLQDITSNRLTRYQLLIKLHQHFWSRCSNEYLSQLQAKTKWKEIDSTDKLKPGTLVI